MPRGIPKSGQRASRPAPKSAFKKGEDARRNNSGQRNKAAVATAAELRALYVEILHEPIDAPVDRQMSNLELIARQQVKAAKQGNADEREKMFDRIWGKSSQPIDLTSSDGTGIRAGKCV